MEPVSAAIGVAAASAQFFKEVIKLTQIVKSIYEKVEDGPNGELRRWKAELDDLHDFLERVEGSPALSKSGIESAIEESRAVCAQLLDIFQGLEVSCNDTLSKRTWRATKEVYQDASIHRKFDELQRLKINIGNRISVTQVYVLQMTCIFFELLTWP